MPVVVTCQQCLQSFAAAPHLHGRTVACPVCQSAIHVPHPAAAPSPGGSEPGEPQRVLQRTPVPRQQQRRGSSHSWYQRAYLVWAGVALSLLVGSCVASMVISAVFSALSTPRPAPYANLLEARRDFHTTLLRQERIGVPVPVPPARWFAIEHYPSLAGPLAAYVTPPPTDGRRHPAMIWIFGGFSNSISETAWRPALRDNDQSASAFREAGLVMMYPSLRGGNSNPGFIEAFYGEVDDLLAAADYLAAKDYVDPDRIYLGGHSTGGTLVLLAAAASGRFRAVFAFGPVDKVTAYGSDVLPFDTWNRREVELRSPIYWLHAMNGPVFVFEGGDGNIGCLRAMRRASRNPNLHFFEAARADHFDILAPVTLLIAQKIPQDTGPSCNISFTSDEINRRFSSENDSRPPFPPIPPRNTWPSAYPAGCSPLDFGRVEYRAFDARSLVVPAACVVFHFGDASEADTDPASHRGLERHLAGGTSASCQFRDGFHHHLGATAHDAVRASTFLEDLFEHFGDQPAVATTAVVGRQMNLDPQALKVLDAGQHLRRARPVAQRDLARGGNLPRWRSVTPMSQELGRQSQERRLPDAARHHDQMLDRLGRKTISQRAPDPQLLAGNQFG
jgi:dienelactone hydrolase